MSPPAITKWLWLSQITSAEGRTQSFEYDALGRVTGWTRQDGTVVGYRYDGSSVTTLLPDGEVLVRTAESWDGDPVTTAPEAMQAALDASLRSWLENLKRTAEHAAD